LDLWTGFSDGWSARAASPRFPLRVPRPRVLRGYKTRSYSLNWTDRKMTLASVVGAAGLAAIVVLVIYSRF
jgi:hypothetical protein